MQRARRFWDLTSVNAPKSIFSATRINESTDKWMRWANGAEYSGSIQIGENYALYMWDDTGLPIFSTFVQNSIAIYDASDRSLVLMKYTDRGEKLTELRCTRVLPPLNGYQVVHMYRLINLCVFIGDVE